MMNHSWTSTRHCRASLKVLLDKLNFITSSGRLTPPTLVTLGNNRRSTTEEISEHPETMDGRRDRNNKRRRYADLETSSSVPPPPMDVQWQPILEYLGPDFGFDANKSYNGVLDSAGSFTQNSSHDSMGLLFEDVGWDWYVQNLESHLNF